MWIILYELAKRKNSKLTSNINKLEKHILTFPEADFYCSRNQKRYKWYQTDGKNSFYIPKSNRALAEQLATKKFLTFLLNDLKQEQNAIKSYLDLYNPDANQAQQLLEHPEYHQLLHTAFQQTDNNSSKWVSEPYLKNPYHPEHLIHKTITGEYVRSKSEALISMYLTMNKIPYRYECLLQLGDQNYYPDFTIMHPITKNIFYWEHFGRMDDSAYVQKTFSKLQTYSDHGIIPTIQLITTYETKQNPLNHDIIQNIIDFTFK